MQLKDRVALITLNRPEARNALSDRLTPALRRIIKQCGDDPEVGALLITGAGNAFCAGGDVKAMGNNSNKTEMSFEERVADLRTKQRTLTGALVAVRKPTVAALPGAANHDPFLKVGHCLFSLLAGLLGGTVALWFWARRERGGERVGQLSGA